MTMPRCPRCGAEAIPSPHGGRCAHSSCQAEGEEYFVCLRFLVLGPAPCSWRGCLGLVPQYAAARARFLGLLQLRLVQLDRGDDLEDDLDVALRELGAEVRREDEHVGLRRSLRTILGPEEGTL